MNYSIVAKYIKDINFNIPDAKSFFLIEKNIGKYRINFDIKSQKLKDGVVEIDTNLKLLSDGGDENKITVSILYSSLISIFFSSETFFSSLFVFSSPTRGFYRLCPSFVGIDIHTVIVMVIFSVILFILVRLRTIIALNTD